MTTTITPAKTDDILAIAKMFHDDMADIGIQSDIADMRLVADSVVHESLGETTDSSCWCWVARDEAGDAVGVIVGQLQWSLKFSGRAIWIEELYVAPSARRQGIARRLVERLLDEATELGIKGVDIEAYRGNTPAAILYRSLGFHRLGRERFYYRVGDEEYL